MHDGKPLTGNNTYDLANSGVGLASSGGYITDIQSKLDAVKQKIVSGQIKVKTDSVTRTVDPVRILNAQRARRGARSGRRPVLTTAVLAAGAPTR